MEGIYYLRSMRRSFKFIMSALICCFFLLALSYRPTKENGLERIASEMKKMKEELFVLDAFCKGSSRRDIRLLRETASKLESARAHDQLSLYSSVAGLAGGVMVLAGSLIPSPLSPSLVYYGGYLTASSIAGHVGNSLLGEESYDFAQVRNVLETVNEFYDVMLRLENAYNTLLKLQLEAVLKGKNGKTLSKQEQQNVLFKIEKLWDMKRELEDKKEITLSDATEFVNNLFDFLDYVYHALGEGSADLKQEIQSVSETAVGLPKQAYAVSTFVRDMSYRSSTRANSLATGVISKSVHSQSLLTAGAMKTALVGVTSLISIVTESKNIEEVSRKIQHREDFVRFLREVADDMQRVCNGSPYCVT